MYWYVLFVKSGREECRAIFKERTKSGYLDTFYTVARSIVQKIRSVKKEIRLLFPGMCLLNQSYLE